MPGREATFDRLQATSRANPAQEFGVYGKTPHGILYIMLRLPRRLPFFLGSLLICLTSLSALAATLDAAPVLAIEGLGKGTMPLDGPWQFHLGDDSTWAQPQTDDTGWEQLSPNKTWGAQGHPSYVGYAWYRKHVHLSLAPGADANVAMLIGHIDDVYEIYWNGLLVEKHGTMPPHGSFPYFPPVQTFGLGPVRDGVLAIRVWKAPLMSFDPDTLGGLTAPPILGAPMAIAAIKATADYTWLRSRQYYFGIHALDGLLCVLCLLAWLRNRSRRVLLAMAAFSGSPLGSLFLVGMRLPIPFDAAIGWEQPVLSLADIGLWFLLLYLLKLDDNPRLVRVTQALAIVSLTATSMDGGLSFADWASPFFAPWIQAADGILTAVFTTAQMYPLVLVSFAFHKRLELSRWILAIAACTDGMLNVLRIALQQGSRYTHWTLGNVIGGSIFTIYGNVFNAQILADTLLLIAVMYAVYRYIQEAARRQSSMEQEYKSARELQQVLIPETLPSLPGYAFSSSYKPAQEVGGDFFQVIPLEGKDAGSTLILLGDVSGKGLRAAMTVSLIVGAARTAAKYVQNPAGILAELNARLLGRMQNGFATCLALRLDSDGKCVIASAGHPAPYLNKKEITLPGALPLGLLADAAYVEIAAELREGDRIALYTDGLLEARGANGEIFSFERLDALFANGPDAAGATKAAVDFGQDDDITVLTLTRLGRGERPSIQLVAPGLAG